MNSSVNVWMQHAEDDLEAAQTLLPIAHLSNIVAWHSQQCIEKSFKAVLEYNKMDVIHTHDLLKLHKLIEGKINFSIDESSLVEINEIYSETRYPTLLGNMPYGKPSRDEANIFLNFAEYIYNKISILVQY